MLFLNRMLYPGRQTELYDLEKETVNLGELEGVRFIQNYQDEFFDIGSVNEEAFQWKDLDISVLTNSDYIMEIRIHFVMPFADIFSRTSTSFVIRQA